MLAEKQEMARSKETGPKRKYNCIEEHLQKIDRTVTWLARESKLSYPYLYRVSKNDSQPTLSKLFEIAETLKVDPRDLIGDGSEIKD